jgi:beta-glucosidase
VHQPVSDVLAPPRRLVGFTRLNLASGASPVEHVSFPVSELAATPADIESSKPPAVEPGAYQVQVGSETANFSITG